MRSWANYRRHHRQDRSRWKHLISDCRSEWSGGAGG